MTKPLIIIQGTAQSNSVSAMPTFKFFRATQPIDMLKGADPTALEEKIKKWYGSGDEAGDDDSPVKGYVSVAFFE